MKELKELKGSDVVYTCKRVIEKDTEGLKAFPKSNVMWKVEMIHRSTGQKVTVQDYNKKRALRQAFDLMRVMLYTKGAGD